MSASHAVDAEILWDSLTEVERTCLGVAFYRWHGSRTCCWPDSSPWYADPCGCHTVHHAIPPAEQAKLLEWAQKEADRPIFQFVAVRTAELDHQISAALATAATNEYHPIQQMVTLGAGMDTRAWRLPWPPGFKVFEVDSPAVLAFKQRIMSLGSDSSSPGSPPQQQYEVMPALSCEAVVAVPADASDHQELWRRLVAGGFRPEVPAIWLLEGFIGYLTRQDGSALLAALHSQSAPGSRLIMTAPPTRAEQQRSAAAAAAAAAAPDAAPTPAADSAATAAAGAPAARPPALELKLHHATFEEPEETLGRLCASGWQDCQLLTAEQLAHKYCTQTAQPILLGCKH